MRQLTMQATSSRDSSLEGLLRFIVVAGALTVVAGRVWIMSGLPLWLDETWSAMIATQPDWASFWREAWLDCNPPLYYVILKLWVAIFGDSNLALRVPSLLFTTGAAVLAFTSGERHLGRLGAATWAGLILFWVNASTTSVDARGYGMLLFLATASCLVLARLWEKLDWRTALLWLVICDAMFLTHYYAGALIVAQGAVLAMRHRLHLFRVWPVGLAGIVPVAWLFGHAPRLADYARPDVAWYDPLTILGAVKSSVYVLGIYNLPVLVILGGVLAAGLAVNHLSDVAARVKNEQAQAAPQSRGIDAAAISGLLGLAIAFAIGAVQSSLTERYLVPMVPPVLLCLVVLALRSRKREMICIALVSLYLFPSLRFAELRQLAEERNNYGYENASTFLASSAPSRLVFAWDHPAAKILDEGSLAKIGGYFLHRSGLQFTTKALILDEGSNPNAALAAEAGADGSAIIWLYNTRRKSAAKHFPPAFESDPAWSCRHSNQRDQNGVLGAIACIKKAETDD